MTNQYEWEDLKETSWTNAEFGTTEGYKLPCGRTFPSEFFSKNDALEQHNDNDCKKCEKMYNTDASKRSQLIADRLSEKLEPYGLRVSNYLHNDLKDLYGIVKRIDGAMDLNHDQIELIKSMKAHYSEDHGKMWLISLVFWGNLAEY